MKFVAMAFALSTAALAVLLGLIVTQPYYAHRLADWAGSDHLGYRSTVHAETMQFVNAGRLQQGGADLALFGASTIERLDVRRFGTGALNLAYGGWTTRDVLSYWQSNPEFAHLDKVVILVGFNDLATGREPADISHDLAEVLDMYEGDEPVLLVGVLPVAERGVAGGVTNAAVAKVNARLARICIEARNSRFADPARGPHRFATPLDSEFDAGDGVHLNAQGNRRLADLIETHLTR